MKKLIESKYCEGFSDATCLDIEEAAEQISAMNHSFSYHDYNEGVSDGEAFVKIFQEQKRG